MFSYCTGGPFGLEDMITTSGPGMSLIYQLVIPFFWCIPVSLVSAELTTAMPVQGGFYRWSRAAFGDFWGFLAGWKHWLVSCALIALITALNIRGIQMVGKAATLFETFIFIPVITMVVLG